MCFFFPNDFDFCQEHHILQWKLPLGYAVVVEWCMSSMCMILLRNFFQITCVWVLNEFKNNFHIVKCEFKIHFGRYNRCPPLSFHFLFVCLIDLQIIFLKKHLKKEKKRLTRNWWQVEHLEFDLECHCLRIGLSESNFHIRMEPKLATGDPSTATRR